MSSLNTDINRIYETPEDGNSVAVAANTKIYQGSLVSVNSEGYGRPLQGGDKPLGFAKDFSDNIEGSDGEQIIDVKAKGKVSLFISGLTMADVGSKVYATDDNTFTLNSSGGSYVGKVARFEKSDYAIVAFDFFMDEVVSPQEPQA